MKNRPDNQRLNNISLVYFITLITLVIIYGVSYLTFERYQALNQTWQTQYERATKINVALSEVDGAFGYGGFIHNFKNLILRLDSERYDAKIEKNIEEFTIAINQLDALLKQENDKQAVQQIKQTFDEYTQKYYLVSPMVKAGKNSDEIDAVVKVDDGPALNAHRILVNRIAERTAEHAKLAKTTYEEAVQFLWINALIITLSLLFAVVFLISSMRKVWNQKIELAEEKQKLKSAYQKDKEVQEELKILTQRLLVATQASKLGVWELDLLSNRLTWDENMYRLYGKDPEKTLLLIEAWEHALHPEDRALAQKIFHDAVENGHDFEHLFRITLDDKSIRHIQAWAQLVFDEHGAPMRMVGVNQDVSERIKTLEDLRIAKEHAESANEAKDQFLANFSHEIRTPLNAVIGLSELGANEARLKVTQQYHEKIYKSGQHLLHIINDILDFSKIEAGKFKFECRPMNMRQLFDNLKQFFDNMASSKGVEFKIVIANKISPAYFGDQLRLTQVLTNLIGNAIKFTENGSVTLTVGCAKPSEHLNLVQFSVKDTGVGIDANSQQALFEPFEQVDNSHTRTAGGTGLGLAISKRLVNGMGGADISLKSVVGEGSEFYFELPMAESSVVPVFRAPEKAHLTSIQGHVLVAEDNDINQEVVKAKLSQYGLKVTLANDGREAVNLAKEGQYDLILMDIQMPNMDGYEATKAIREFNEYIPIIALTAAARNEDREMAIHAGMNGHLSKPIDSDRLEQVLMNWLESKVASQVQDTNHASENALSSEPSHHAQQYIDRDVGLKMLDGDQLVYEQLLIKLLDQLKNEFSLLLDALHDLCLDSSEEDWKYATLHVHTLKGVTCTMAAQPLCDLCSEIDTLLKSNHCPDSVLLEQYKNTFEATIEELERITK